MEKMDRVFFKCIIQVIFYFLVVRSISIRSSTKFTVGELNEIEEIELNIDINEKYIVIGNHLETVAGIPNAGSITIYSHNEANKTSEGVRIVPDDITPYSNFGYSVSISNNRVIVGCPGSVEGYIYKTGSAYIYKLENDGWSLETKLVPSDPDVRNIFGYSVSIDGDYAVIGDPKSRDREGAAYIFMYKNGKWSEQKKLQARRGGKGDCFGEAVAVNGQHVVVGASWRNSDKNVGTAYIYRSYSDIWMQEAMLFPKMHDTLGYFGSKVDISDNRVIIGSSGESNYTGAAYLYKKINGFWNLEHIFNASDGKGGDMISGDRFGADVSIDGDTIAISAPFTDDVRLNSGTVYYYEKANGKWVQKRKLLPWDESTTMLGFSLGLHNKTLIAGCMERDVQTGQNGASIYAFQLKDATT